MAAADQKKGKRKKKSAAPCMTKNMLLFGDFAVM